MTWPVNYIEKARYYTQMVDELNSLTAQAQTITIHAFTQPTQQEWEDAYFNQIGQLPPIQPGAKLFWYDAKNGIPKRFSTVFSPDGVTIDPLVRRHLPASQPRSCFRFLGIRQGYEDSQFMSVNSPVRHRHFSLMYDLETLVKKNLLALSIHFRDQSPVMIAPFGDTFGSTQPEDAWGNTVATQWWTLQRVTTTTTPATAATNFEGFQPIASWAGVTTIASTPVNHGTALVFAPAAPFVSEEHQPFSAGLNYMSLAVAKPLTGAGTLELWQAFGSKYDGSGLKNLSFGSPATRTASVVIAHAYMYSLFAVDPGPFEVFDDNA